MNGGVGVGVSQTKRKTGREEEGEGDRRVSHDVRERRTPIEMAAKEVEKEEEQIGYGERRDEGGKFNKLEVEVKKKEKNWPDPVGMSR